MSINYVAVFVASLVTFIFGWLWYSPLLFGKKFIEWTGMKPDPEKPINPLPLYSQAFLISLVTFYVLAHFVQFTNATTFKGGAETAFWIWLGFIMPTQFTANLFSDKTRKLFFLDTFYQLFTVTIGGGVLAVWK